MPAYHIIGDLIDAEFTKDTSVKKFLAGNVMKSKFGYFDDTNREYVITNPQTPYPWINYLGNEDFYSFL